MSQDEDSLVHTGNIADINTVIFKGDHRYTYVQNRLSLTRFPLFSIE